MAVTSCTVLPTGLAANLTTANSRRGGSVNVTYRIRETDYDAMPLTVFKRAQAATPDPLPERWAPYNVRGETEFSLYARNITLTHQDENGAPTGVWLATVQFGELDAGQTAAHAILNPLARPPVVWLEFETLTEPVDYAVFEGVIDRDGQTVLASDVVNAVGTTVLQNGATYPPTNAAKGPLEDGLHEDRTTVILAREDYYTNLQTIITRHDTYERTLNNNNVSLGSLVFPARHMKYVGMSAPQIVNEGGSNYYKATTRIALNRFKPFSRDIVNQGFMYKTDVDGTLTEMMNNQAEPTLLTEKGDKLPDGQLGNYVRWRTRTVANYTPLVAGIS